MDKEERDIAVLDAGISKELAEELCISLEENALLYEEFHGTSSRKGKDDT